MSDASDHSKSVKTWMTQSAEGLSPEQLLQLFEQAMAALWNRAHRTLGDVTLGAITDRVLYSAYEQFSPFESLKVEVNGIDFRQLRERGEVFDSYDLVEGIRFVLVEFLSVIGNLTGEILTPALHLELSKVVLDDSAKDKGKP